MSTLGSKQKTCVSNIDLFYHLKKEGSLKNLALPAPTLHKIVLV